MIETKVLYLRNNVNINIKIHMAKTTKKMCCDLHGAVFQCKMQSCCTHGAPVWSWGLPVCRFTLCLRVFSPGSLQVLLLPPKVQKHALDVNPELHIVRRCV